MHFSEISQKRPALDFFRDWKNTYLIDKNFVAFNFRRSQFSSDIIFVTKPTLSLLSYENSQQIIVSFSCYSYYLLLLPILASSAIVSYLCNRLRWVCNRCSFFCYVRYLSLHCAELGNFAFIISIKTDKKIYSWHLYVSINYSNFRSLKRFYSVVKICVDHKFR